MTYKLPKPEDYQDIESYQFKLSRAYTTIYSNYLVLLVNIDSIYDAIKCGDDTDREWAIKKLAEIIKNHKS